MSTACKEAPLKHVRLNVDGIPAELRAQNQWVLWRSEPVRNGDLTKRPYQVNGQLADSTDPTTWAPFEYVLDMYERGGFAGLGFMFSSDDPYTGVDLDGCRDPQTGVIAPWAQEWIDKLSSYTEVSPTGTGIKAWVRGSNPKGRGGNRKLSDMPRLSPAKDPGVEIYDRERFFVATGQHVDGTPTSVEPAQEALAEFVARYWPTRNAAERRSSRPSAEHGQDQPTRCRAYVAKMPDAISGSGGHNATFAAACECFRFGLTDSEAAEVLGWFNDTKTAGDPWSDHEIEHKLQDAREQVTRAGEFGCRLREDRRDGPRNVSSTNGVNQDQRKPTADPNTYALTDSGNAERFAFQHADKARYCYPMGKWLSWDGRRWCLDGIATVEQLAKQTARSIYTEAASASDDDERKAIARWAQRSESSQGRAAMLRLAQSEPGIPIQPVTLDRNPWALNCKNGTIDLRTGDLRPHRRDDYITKLCEIPYDPNAKCELFERVLRRNLADNTSVISCLQRLLGHCLTGDTSEQILPIWVGDGGNGKSLLINLCLHLLGPDYSMKAPPDMLMVRRGDAHPTERADLFGKRLVACVETDADCRLAESLVKELTGGDKIRARRMREDFWEFSPTHKIVLACNHKPVVRGTDHAIWRRIRLFPFTVVIPDAEKDGRLFEKLQAESSGILAWAVQGCLDWQRNGLQAPPEVLAATAEYRQQQDQLAQFLTDCCVVDRNAKARASDLLQAYRKWAGDERMTQRRLGEALNKRGFDSALVGGYVWRLGVGVKDEVAA